MSLRIIVACVFCLVQLAASRMTMAAPNSASIRAAYQSIPHRQTTYLLKRSTLQTPVASELEQLFSMVDQAIVLRVEVLRSFQSSEQVGIPYSRYQRQMNELLKTLGVPFLTGDAEYVRQIIRSALHDQLKFFASWHVQKKKGQTVTSPLDADPKVRSASGKLKRAYEYLVHKFPQENTLNKQAFYDHIFSLDF